MTGAGTGDEARLELRAVLANTARELEMLAVKAGGIDTAVGEMLAEGEGAHSSAALLQDVDLLRQSVDCLHILIGNLARQGDGTCTLSAAEAAEGVYLERIRKGCLGR